MSRVVSRETAGDNYGSPDESISGVQQLAQDARGKTKARLTLEADAVGDFGAVRSPFD